MATTREHILLVEDSENEEELTILALREAGLELAIEVARDGEQALAHLSDGAGSALPKLVILDLDLPKVHGLEVLRRIREQARTRSLVVVILSSSDRREDVTRAFHLGVNSFVRKPVDANRYADVVRELGHYWTAINVQD